VLDVATRKIVGWAMRDHMRTEPALSTLMMAVQRQRPLRGLIRHSDRGSQHAAQAYVEQLGAVGASSLDSDGGGRGDTIAPRDLAPGQARSQLGLNPPHLVVA